MNSRIKNETQTSGVSLPSRDTIKKIIELTAHDCDGLVWGDDTILGTMDELIDDALEILRTEGIDNEQSH